MVRELCCPQGHTWQRPEQAGAACIACPECGLPLREVDEELAPPGQTAPPPGSLLAGAPEASPCGSRAEEAESQRGFRGRFRILRAHAQGGLGRVSVARDDDLAREVALKEIRPELVRQGSSRDRFVNEAQITAQLEHPNIVPVYSFGRDSDGRPYYAMRFVHGRSLHDAIRAHHASPSPAGLRDLLRRFVDVCHAVAYAHSQGIVHRDLKPANVMLGDYGQTLVVDWGVAKRVAHAPAGGGVPHEPGTDEPGLGLLPLGITVAGQAIGTHDYMAPEQAHDPAVAGPAADVFSLGAILREIVSDAATRGGSGASLRGTPKSSLPLAAVADKATSADVASRYASALQLADEVERFLADEPVTAFRDPLHVRAARWTRRHRSVVTAVAALMLATVVALVLSNAIIAGQKNRTLEALAREREAREQARRNLELATANERLARQNLLKSLLAAGDSMMGAGRHADARANLQEAWDLAAQLGEDQRLATAALLDSYRLSPPPLLASDMPRGQGRLPFRHEGAVDALALSSDGRLGVTAGAEGSLKLWDLRTGIELRRFGQGVSQALTLAWSDRDGSEGVPVVATGHRDRTIRLWNVGDGTERRRLRGHTGTVLGVAVSADGRLLMSGSADSTARLWDTASGKSLAVLGGHQGPVNCVALSPDGRLGLSGGDDFKMRLWDVAERKVLREFDSRTTIFRSVRFSPDLKTALSANGDNRLRLWDLDRGEILSVMAGHSGSVCSADFLEDGHSVLSGSWDESLRIWDTRTGSLSRLMGGHDVEVRTIAVSADKTVAISGGSDGSIKVWPLSAAQGNVLVRTQSVRDVAYSHGGRVGVCAGDDGVPLLCDLATGQILRALRGTSERIRSLAVTSSGDTVFAGAFDGNVRVWRSADGYGELQVLGGHSKTVTDLACSSDGRTVISVSADGTMRIWQRAGAPADAYRMVKSIAVGERMLLGVALSADGRLALTGGADAKLRLWDVASGTQLRELSGHKTQVSCVAMSADCKRAVSGSYDRAVHTWDLSGPADMGAVGGHGGFVKSVACSPDAAFVLSAGDDFTARLWDARSGRELRCFTVGTSSVSGVCLAPDGASFLTGGGDGFALWRLDLPEEHRRFDEELRTARGLVARDESHPSALLTFGRWYAFRGMHGWAIDFFERAAAAGAEVPALQLARSYWMAGRLDEARREFQRAIAADEAPEPYLRLCVEALGHDATTLPAAFPPPPTPH